MVTTLPETPISRELFYLKLTPTVYQNRLITGRFFAFKGEKTMADIPTHEEIEDNLQYAEEDGDDVEGH